MFSHSLFVQSSFVDKKESKLKRLVVDLDGTLTQANTSDYRNVLPREDVIQKLREYKSQGFDITISTARNMRTYEGNVGKINIHTLPIITEWLDKHNVPYDEILVGKPWCGHDGFYIDDRAVRPSEFADLSREQINELLEKEKACS
jgi:capsule biosynthesis phosphatase